jgi:hypothetical protein
MDRLITRLPDDADKTVSTPELAYIKDDGIVIEPYL